ncbi:hypothetical protein GFS60_06344 (plasmid) [Rhodococcus sp. WAY2]|nr:hypothetical protein GFS60_06344 [Rhodococcus sp. WAY2]
MPLPHERPTERKQTQKGYWQMTTERIVVVDGARTPSQTGYSVSFIGNEA